MNRLLALLFILFSVSARAELLRYASEESKPIGVADGLLKFEFNYSKSHYTLDVINEFANQLRIESGNADDYEFGVRYYFTRFIFVFGHYKLSQVEFSDSAQHELEIKDLEYSDYNLGFGYNIGAVSLKLGYGGATYHSFLETDTTYYFHDELKSNYIKYGLDYKFETKFGFNVELFVDFQSYLESKIGAYNIDKGDVRKWGGRVAFSSGRFQYGAGYIHTHRTVKMRHDFFSLENEMNNKLLVNQFLVFGNMGF